MTRYFFALVLMILLCCMPPAKAAENSWVVLFHNPIHCGEARQLLHPYEIMVSCPQSARQKRVFSALYYGTDDPRLVRATVRQKQDQVEVLQSDPIGEIPLTK